jgi:hypothetical protein
MTKCSIVILSWNRQENIKLILQQYSNYCIVEEIIVWNNNKNYLISGLETDKIKVINCEQDFGLNSRFVSCLLAKNRCIITHDDDLLLSEANIKNLVDNFIKDHTRIYTYEGRNQVNGEYTYDAEGRVENVAYPTECEVSLTRAACYDKIYATEYLKYCDVIFYDVSLNLNGEDIAFSKIVSNASGKKPLVLPLKDLEGYEELPVTDKISTRNGHLERRTELLKRCELVFPFPGYKKPESNKTIFFGQGFYPFGYMEQSNNFNSFFKKLLVKQSNGIKYLSFNNFYPCDYCSSGITINKNANLDELLQISCFYNGIVLTTDIQLEYSAGDKVFLSRRHRIEVESFQPKDFFISLKDIIDEKEFKISKIIFIFYESKIRSEFCLSEISINNQSS